MPSQSVMHLSRMRRIIFTNTLDQQFTVERGRMETTVTKQVGPGSHYEVRTPIAVSAVRGTVFRVAYDDTAAGASLTEVLDGTVAVGAPGARQSVPVPIGIGAAVARDGSVRTEDLLPAPALAEGNRLQAGRALRFSLGPVPGAVSYHLEIARDAAFQDIVAETRASTPEDVSTPCPMARGSCAPPPSRAPASRDCPRPSRSNGIPMPSTQPSPAPRPVNIAWHGTMQAKRGAFPLSTGSHRPPCGAPRPNRS
jgi:hypothetical protein